MPPLIYDSADSEEEEDGDGKETSEEEERNETGPSTTPTPLCSSSLQELADKGYHFHLLSQETLWNQPTRRAT
jgi:hypothetical protein